MYSIFNFRSVFRNILTRRAFASGIAILLIVVAGLSGIALNAEEITRDGLKIEVIQANEANAVVVPGYSLFRVTVENPTPEDRTLHAVIQLVWKDAKNPDAPPKAEASCVAYLEIPAKHRLTEAVPCKGDKFTSYDFQIKSVLPFVLDRSPLKWQKAQALN